MGATEYQALTVHTRNNFKNKEKKETFHHNKKKDKKLKKTKKDNSNVRYYICDETRHFLRDCPIKKKRHHAHIVENDEPTNKRFRREKDDSDEECVLNVAFTRILLHEEQ